MRLSKLTLVETEGKRFFFWALESFVRQAIYYVLGVSLMGEKVCATKTKNGRKGRINRGHLTCKRFSPKREPGFIYYHGLQVYHHFVCLLVPRADNQRN